MFFTTIVVFVPIITLKGIVGIILSDVALTLMYSMIASLIVSIVVIPFLIKALRKDGENLPQHIHVNNFFATSLVGPLLVMNPYFTEYLMEKLGVDNPKCAFREDSINAYNIRIKDFRSCKSLH